MPPPTEVGWKTRNDDERWTWLAILCGRRLWTFDDCFWVNRFERRDDVQTDLAPAYPIRPIELNTWEVCLPNLCEGLGGWASTKHICVCVCFASICDENFKLIADFIGNVWLVTGGGDGCVDDSMWHRSSRALSCSINAAEGGEHRNELLYWHSSPVLFCEWKHVQRTRGV